MSRSSVRAPQRDSRTRPWACSIAWQASSSSRGVSRVSSATIWFRYGGWAIPASGAVSSTAETPTRAVPGNAASAARAARRCPALSPRLLPSATYARSAAATSRLHDEVPGEALQVRRHVAQLADGALEVGLTAGRLAGPARQGLGLAQRPRGAGRDPADLAGEPVDRPELLRRGGRDRAGVAAGVAGGADDRVQGPGGIGAQLLHAGHRLAPAFHLARDRGHLLGDLLEQHARLAGGVQALRGQVADLVGHHREPTAIRARARGLDGGVEGDQVGQVGDLPDGADEALDARGHRPELPHLVRAGGDEP